MATGRSAKGRGRRLGKSIRRSHRRNSCHLEGSIVASVESVVVGIEVVVENPASRRLDLVEGLEAESKQTRRPAVEHAVAADEGLSALGQCPTSRARAALQKFGGRRAAPAVLLSTFTHGLRR